VAAVPTPPPVAPLRAATAPTGTEAIRQIKDILDTTLKMLDKVEKSETPLSDDRKANLSQARALVNQTEEALKKEELTQARSFAERAQNIAKLLASGR
jgi:phage shock protein A